MVANIISSAFAIAAAVLWLRSALVKTPKKFPLRAVQYDEYVENPVAGSIPEHSPGTVQSEALAQLGIALQRQSKLSAWAAGCACIASVAQAIAVW
jgi:hypothetical protein